MAKKRAKARSLKDIKGQPARTTTKKKKPRVQVRTTKGVRG